MLRNNKQRATIFHLRSRNENAQTCHTVALSPEKDKTEHLIHTGNNKERSILKGKPGRSTTSIEVDWRLFYV